MWKWASSGFWEMSIWSGISSFRHLKLTTQSQDNVPDHFPTITRNFQKWPFFEKKPRGKPAYLYRAKIFWSNPRWPSIPRSPAHFFAWIPIVKVFKSRVGSPLERFLYENDEILNSDLHGTWCMGMMRGLFPSPVTETWCPRTMSNSPNNPRLMWAMV